jgi:hypothetical protein
MFSLLLVGTCTAADKNPTLCHCNQLFRANRITYLEKRLPVRRHRQVNHHQRFNTNFTLMLNPSSSS